MFGSERQPTIFRIRSDSEGFNVLLDLIVEHGLGQKKVADVIFCLSYRFCKSMNS